MLKGFLITEDYSPASHSLTELSCQDWFERAADPLDVPSQPPIDERGFRLYVDLDKH